MAKKNRTRSTFLINEPNWILFKSAKTDDEQLNAYKYADYFVHYEINDKTKVAAFQKWLKSSSGFDKDTIQRIKKIPDHNFVTVGKFAYIENKLGYIPQIYLDYMHKCVPEWLKQVKTVNKEPMSTIQDHMRLQVAPLGEKWDMIVDRLISGKFDVKNFDAYRDMISFKTPVKAPQAKIIRNEYIKAHEESKLIVLWTDSYIKESYKHLTVNIRRDLLKFYEKIVLACDVIISTQKANRKKPKRKINKIKSVSGLKYKINEPNLGISSINPTEIMDASEIWILIQSLEKLVFISQI